MNRIDFKDVKLIIWDLDETLWRGTLSEESVSIIPENEDFIKATTNAGIVHSICSKNDFQQVKQELIKLGLWECFVFPSIDWNSKGTRVQAIIEDMGLRNINCVFVDDNIQNLREVEYCAPGIMTILADELSSLYEDAKSLPAKDLSHKRLKQYKVLEEKASAKKSYTSNEEFLLSCDIQVVLHEDAINKIDRIHELVMRTNQLNYTKVRSSYDELLELIQSEGVKSGYVTAKDKFGDYGIVGFYAVVDGQAVHYCYSCRTLGMLVEQYVYMRLGCPKINVVPEVITELKDDYLPPWINQESAQFQTDEKLVSSERILIKGPCDMDQMFSFIKKTPNIVTEFSYTADNDAYIIGLNHTAQIVTAVTADVDRKAEIINDSPWFDKGMLETSLGSEVFDCVFISLLADSVLGVYRRKKTGELIAFAESNYDLTDKANWSKYLSGEIYTGNACFTNESLEEFARNYEYVDNSDAHITIESLEKIYEVIGKKTKLVLILGSQVQHKNNTKLSYKGKHMFHTLMNSKIREWAEVKSNVVLIDLSHYVKSQQDYVDTINHFVKRVYFDLAKEIVNIFNSDVRIKNRRELAVDKLKFLYRSLRKNIKLRLKIK